MVVVVGTGDHRGQQAYVRLVRVYGLPDVRLYEEGVAGWGAAGGMLQAGPSAMGE